MAARTIVRKVRIPHSTHGFDIIVSKAADLWHVLLRLESVSVITWPTPRDEFQPARSINLANPPPKESRHSKLTVSPHQIFDSNTRKPAQREPKEIKRTTLTRRAKHTTSIALGRQPANLKGQLVNRQSSKPEELQSKNDSCVVGSCL